MAQSLPSLKGDNSVFMQRQNAPTSFEILFIWFGFLSWYLKMALRRDSVVSEWNICLFLKDKYTSAIYICMYICFCVVSY